MFLDIPNELILQVAENLSLSDLDHLLQTNRFLERLLSPILLKRAITALVTVKRRSVLHWAAVHDRGPLMKLLLERGARASIDTVDDNGMTALHSAAIRGHKTPVKLLLENGANIEIESKLGWTPLLLAAITGNSTVTRLLLERGASVQIISRTFSNKNALHYAVALGHISVVDVLIEMGCDPGALDWYGVDATQIAAEFGQEMMAKRLLDLGGFCKNPYVDSSICLLSVSAIRFHIYLCQSSLIFDKDFCKACSTLTEYSVSSPAFAGFI